MASLTRLSVLIADDDAARSWDVAVLLRELGVQHVSEVADAEQLEAALRERAFDVLFCSEQIAGRDGVTLLRAARKRAPATRAVLTRWSDRTEPLPGDIEAVQLPLSRAGLLDLLQQTASPLGGLWCEVPALSLSDILQMYHQARRSITVLLSGPVAGRVRLDAGEIVDAEMGDERGLTALSRLLEAETGLIRTAPTSAGDDARTIDAPFQSVLLEAARELDERRRDRQRSSENTSVSADVLRPSVPLPFQAHAPDPASFLAPPAAPRRPRWGLAVTGLLLGTGLAAGAVVYLQRDGQPRRAELTLPPGPAPAIEQSAHALRPAAPAGPSGAAAPAPPDEPSAPSPPSSFTLHITSKPSRATVVEAGRVLGKTPLDVPISASSVARGPRRFMVRHSGYLPSRLTQGPADANVSTLVVLQPRSMPLAELPDAGRPEPEAAGARGRRRDPGARPRR